MANVGQEPAPGRMMDTRDKEVAMNPNQQRDMMDRAGRDEARLRQDQQDSAGEGHRPVHARPPHGEPSPGPRSDGAAAGLSGAYVQALDNEHAAWRAVRGLPGEPAFDRAAWDSWRSAVEERDLATRLLINYALSAPPQP